jgi:hypothetical protein
MTEPSDAVLRVLSGQPSAAELAAVTVLLLAAAGSAPAEPAPVPPSGGWADPARRLRRPPAPGPGAWRASARD